MKIQPSLEKALGHKGIPVAYVLVRSPNPGMVVHSISSNGKEGE